MRSFLLLLALSGFSCSQLLPGKLRKLPPEADVFEKNPVINLDTRTGKTLSVQYLGCGGLYLLKGEEGILIDPFFSNQGLGRLIVSTLANRRSLASDPQMVALGLRAICRQDSLYCRHVKAILVAHSHYDHLMDVPAVFAALAVKPEVYLNESGRTMCQAVIRPEKIRSLEEYAASPCAFPPIRVGQNIRIYPIPAGHNPHFNHIKFFDGSLPRALPYFNDPYARTKANDWLAGTTFSFLIDYLEKDSIELRLFVQSSSCNPMAGIPPDTLLRQRPVDLAFLGLASYEASPLYPETLIGKIRPKQIVWVHWEDFFRRYTREKPKTVRATHVDRFFQKPVVQAYRGKSRMPWPRTVLEIRY